MLENSSPQVDTSKQYGSKVDYKALLNNIKQKYPTDRDSFDFFLKHAGRKELGIKNIDTKTFKMDLRGEKTPSTTITKFLHYCDFGGEGVRKDIIELIQKNTNCSFIEAIKTLCEWDNQSIENVEFKPLFSIEEQKEKEKPYSDKYIRFQQFQSKEKANIFKPLLDGLCRSCSDSEKKRAIEIFDIGLNSYDLEEKINEDLPDSDKSNYKVNTYFRLFIPEYDIHKVPYGSFRYNRNLTPKGLLRTNCQRVLFGSHLFNSFNLSKPIIFAEGHSDSIVNNSKRMQTVTTGSCTTKINQESLDIMKGKTFHFYPDCDFPGLKGVCNRIIEIETFNKELPENEKIKYQVFWWAKTFFCPKKEITFTKRDIVKSQIELYKAENFNAPEEAKFKNWKILKTETVLEGYDWIDFHRDTANHEKYKDFIKSYFY